MGVIQNWRGLGRRASIVSVEGHHPKNTQRDPTPPVNPDVESRRADTKVRSIAFRLHLVYPMAS